MGKGKNRVPLFSGLEPLCLQLYGLLKKLPLWNDRSIGKSLNSLRRMNESQLQEQIAKFRCRQIACVLLVWIGTLTLWAVLITRDAFGSEQKQASITIERNAYGQAASEETLLVTPEGQETEEALLEVQPREYTEKELKIKFQEAMDYVEKHLKGENESLDCVWKPLHMPVEIPDNPVEIRWMSDRFDLIHTDGSVMSEGVRTPSAVILTAIFSCQEEEKQATYPVCVVKPRLSPEEAAVEKVMEKIRQQEKNSRQKKSLTIPVSIDDAVISRREESKRNYGRVIFLGLMVSILLFVKQQGSLKEQVKKRNRQLELAYPELVRQLGLLLDAGITMKGAFRKLGEKYQRTREAGGDQKPLYEEILMTNRQMEQGISQTEALEQWGRRMDLTVYRKLANLLLQNASRGNAGLTELLEQEELTAMEHRRQLARKLGEEAGTKLLVPMTVLLVVTIAIILMPALIQFQI